jgi:hypothetical protein
MATVQTRIRCRADSSITRGTGHDDGGIFSFIHLDDDAAATTTVLALEHEEPAVNNIVDDEPAPSASGCPRSRTRSAPSRLATSRSGSRG